MRKIVRESRICYGPDGRPLLRATLYAGMAGGWELEVVDLVVPGRVAIGYAGEPEAWQAIRQAYALGTRHGTWRTPSAGQAGTVAGSGIE
jgi:hypothetical protein